MNELEVFSFDQKDVRVVMVNEEPWWVLKDVCDVLGLSNPTVVADRLEEDEKLNKPDLTSLGQRGGWIINESGLYSVILRSEKPEAKRFRKWVTSEVLPAIRKNGGYLSSAVDFSDPDKIQVLLDRWKEDRKKRLEAEARVGRLVHNNRTYSTSEVAKELGMKSAQELNQLLSEKGIQYKDRRGVWLLYSDYADKGFQNIKQKEVNGTVVYYSEWTGIGRDWLIGLLSR